MILRVLNNFLGLNSIWPAKYLEPNRIHDLTHDLLVKIKI